MKKPAAGAARIQIFYSPPPLQKTKKRDKGGGSVAKRGDYHAPERRTFSELYIIRIMYVFLEHFDYQK